VSTAPALGGIVPEGAEDNAARIALSMHAGSAPGVDAFAADPSHAHAPHKHLIEDARVKDDVEGHRIEAQCWHHFDLGFLEDWDGRGRMFCLPLVSDIAGSSQTIDTVAGVGDGGALFIEKSSWGVGEDETIASKEISSHLGPPFRVSAADQLPATFQLPSSSLSQALVAGDPAIGSIFPLPGWLRCRVVVDSHLPSATAPHTLCDGGNVLLDPSLLTPTGCLASRPGYKCGEPSVHWAFSPGALSAGCSTTPHFNPSTAFPRDHLMDMFSGWRGWEEGMASPHLLQQTRSAEGDVVLLVARERGEHQNLFHATTDWINCYISLVLAGIVDPLTGGREGMGQVQVLLLDEQSGPFEDAWYGRVLSPSHPILRASGLRTEAKQLLRLRRALFVPPGYTNFMLSHVLSEGDCHARTQLLEGWRRFVLTGLGLKEPQKMGWLAGGSATGRAVRITFISRRPYEGHGAVGRQIDNEEDLLDALRALGSVPLSNGDATPPHTPAVVVTRVDFAGMDAVAQVTLIAEETDVLVGMHGAGLTYASLLPPWGALVELWPKQSDMWRCFEHLATMSGMFYERWANSDWGSYREDAMGDYTRVDSPAVIAIVKRAVQHVVEYK